MDENILADIEYLKEQIQQHINSGSAEQAEKIQRQMELMKEADVIYNNHKIKE